MAPAPWPPPWPRAGTFSRSYIQPAGTVTATAVREGGKVVKTYIGGPVTLGEPFETEVKG